MLGRVEFFFVGSGFDVDVFSRNFRLELGLRVGVGLGGEILFRF